MPLTASINCGRGRRFCTFRVPSLLLAGGSAAWRRMPPSPSARRRAGGRRVADFEMPHECKEKGSKRSAIAHDPRMALGTCELGQRSAVPCRAVPCCLLTSRHSQWGGFVLRRGSLQNWCSCRQQPVQLLSCVSWAECVRALLFSVCCFNLARLCQETRDSSLRAAMLIWA